MSNPFGDPNDESSEILEGFLCPICREDLKSLEFLTDHFERAHTEEQDALKSIFKDIFSKAKRKIRLNFDDINTNDSSYSSNNENVTVQSLINVNKHFDPQKVGAEQSHLQYFQSVRNPRLERYATETNKLIIRLNKLLRDMPADPVQRKQHEQEIVSWLEGSAVKLCPNCAHRFHIARRQHHCRLCGSIMCNDCSKFLNVETALSLASLTNSEQIHKMRLAATSNQQQQNKLRTCEHCLRLLETRQEMLESRTCRPPITELYAEIQKKRNDVLPDIEMYLKIIGSLCEGESIFTIADASRLRGKIGQTAEIIDALSKRIMALPSDQGSREENLKKSVRQSCIQMIKDKMLSLPPVPNENEIQKIQEQKRIEAEKRIETERRMAKEAYERYGLGVGVGTTSSEKYVQGSDLHSLESWSTCQVTSSHVQSDDPLVEQINLIKGYIKQARQDMNFDVVETLEINLRELQREFYQRQRSTTSLSSTLNSDNIQPK